MEVHLFPRKSIDRPVIFIDVQSVHVDDGSVCIVDRNGDYWEEKLIDWDVEVTVTKFDYVF